ncbi:MAG: acyl-CoA dehydrogenase [Planctomycetes bacterium RBG_16_59_8]|nr:MAG: acyl-CoA dehydrogenase [Planctomycetes bacterium RBG_16_59_8]
MDFHLSDEESLIRQTARDFADREVKPVAAEVDDKEDIPTAIIQKMAELGFMGMLIPEKYGGAGLNVFSLTLAAMELNRASASVGITMSVHNSLVASPILHFGNDEQKQRFLPRLASAEAIGAYALTEAGAGSDAAALSTAAPRDGGDYILNGEKLFVTNGAIADLFIVFVRTHPDRAVRAKGISAFVVERDTAGFTVGKKEKKMGIRGSSTVSLHFDDCRVPAANLIGTENGGFAVAMHTLDGGRVGVAAQSVGIAEACLESSLKYAKERKQFGKFIGEFQAIQWKVADMATRLDAARLLTLRAARLRDEDAPHTKEAAMAKLFASTLANDAATQAIQVHGGVGYTKEFPVERFFRDAKITEIYEGTTEVQKIVIARELLK